jgi:hypothetical protein
MSFQGHCNVFRNPPPFLGAFASNKASFGWLPNPYGSLSLSLDREFQDLVGRLARRLYSWAISPGWPRRVTRF